MIRELGQASLADALVNHRGSTFGGDEPEDDADSGATMGEVRLLMGKRREMAMT